MYLQNKYTQVYNNIIERAKSRTISGYTEKHHIIPRSLGGSNNKDNIVALTAREHFIAHMCLARFTQGDDKRKMITAARFMAVAENPHQTRYFNARLYEAAKQAYNKQQIGHPHYGPFVQSKESNEQRSNKMKAHFAKHGTNFKGKTHTDEARAKMRDKAVRGPKSEDHRAKIAEANRINGLKKRGKSLPKTECCGRMYDPGNLSKHRKSGKCLSS